MHLSFSHGREFVSQIRPYLERHDPEGLLRHLERHWPVDQLRLLLETQNTEAIKVALVCLSMTGDMLDNARIAPFLGDEDSMTAALAEHAMWSIWFRGHDEIAGCELTRAVQLLSQNRLNSAVRCLNRLIKYRPDFAEAYNQRAIAYFLKEAYDRSIEDCEQALRLNPYHFGAMAGIGHCHAAMGRLECALAAYTRSLQMHPRLEGIRQSIRQIREKLTHVQAPASPSAAPLPARPA